ncbi:MAG: hypothetical protein AB1758_13900, partial [Candidatus Eremiobacterota bacterium]
VPAALPGLSRAPAAPEEPPLGVAPPPPVTEFAPSEAPEWGALAEQPRSAPESATVEAPAPAEEPVPSPPEDAEEPEPQPPRFKFGASRLLEKKLGGGETGEAPPAASTGRSPSWRELRNRIKRDSDEPEPE